MSEVRRKHTVKLAHGFRIECVTTSDRDAKTVTLNAFTYEATETIAEHVGMATGSSLNTSGCVIDWRNEFLADIQALLEGSVRYMVAARNAG